VTLYDDDGDTAAWRDGAGLVTRVTLARTADGAEISAQAVGQYKPVWRTLHVRCLSGAALRIASVSGVDLSVGST